MTDAAVDKALKRGRVVKEQVSIGEGCPVTPLGVNGDYYYLLAANGSLKVRKFREFTDAALQDLFAGNVEWLNREFEVDGNRRDGKASWDTTAARGAIMRACNAAGFFNPNSHERGAGVWDDDAGGLVVHCGDAILHISYDAEGAAVNAWSLPGRWFGDHVYPAALAEPRPYEGAVRTDVGDDILTFLKTWSWKSPSSEPFLLLGFIGAAALSGAVPFRPPIWLVGDTTTGKSTILRLLREIYGDGLLYLDDTTAPATRDMIGRSARPVILDEFEQKERSEKTRDLIELTRNAYTTGQGHYARAGANKKQGTVEAHFFISSVEPPVVLPQDANRRAVLELDEIIAGGMTSRQVKDRIRELGKLGPRLRRRMFDQWPRFDDVFETYHAAFMAAKHTSRGADTFGVLLACQDLLLSDYNVDLDTAREWAELLSPRILTARGVGSSDTADKECWSYLMGSAVDKWGGGEQKIVAELLQDALINIDPASDTLKRYGIMIVERPDPDIVREHGEIEGLDTFRWIAVGNSHRRLKELFAGSRWAGGGWGAVLKRLKGARVWPNPMRIKGVLQRVTLIPIDHIGEDDFAKAPPPDLEEKENI